jgi:hypothetical protein
MADIGITNCTIQRKTEGGFQDILIITPLTADSADTVDVSSLVIDTQVCQVYGFDMITGDNVSVTIAPSTNVITIDAAGGTTNHVYVLRVTCVSFPIAVA